VSKVLIRVKYLDDGYDMVKKNVLDILLDSNKVVEFKRATGWVRVGVDPIRKTRRDRTTIQQ
jgi:hypothetical protein